ncbi:MAG TPA: SpoIVB peptidase S55 domain-containing protein [Vicinamibacterales bacterium]|nr:SpoIVB peptidase S55 domain-containing protein [Vicinamibacterales bacterium]
MKLLTGLASSLTVATVLFASPLAADRQTQPFFPVDDIRPGMTAVGRTVFGGDQIEEFQVHILGVLRNIAAPQRDLILARLEGGPLAHTGVIAGMSGSPVYINGRLVGAVSYSLGSFPKEPIAGITPIGEMIGAVGSLGSARGPGGDMSLTWPATPAAVFGALERIAMVSGSRIGGLGGVSVQGPASLLDFAPALRPIGAAMVMSGVDPSVDRELRKALNLPAGDQAPASGGASRAASPLRPGDPIGMALIRGDLDMGATGTVTHVDGSRVYAFGHPFLNLGPTTMVMTQARVFTVLPSLDSSMKIATLGPAVGTMTQDRATAVAGILGPEPPQVALSVTLRSAREAERRLQFKVLHDQTLTPLFTYVAVLNALAAYQRQTGPLSVGVSGEVSFGDAGRVAIDDMFSGEGAAAQAAAAAIAPVGIGATNEFRPALADRVDLTITVTETQNAATIERVWLDTTRPKFGATHQLNVLLRDYRGGTETVTMPVAMPAHATGPLTLVVGDAPTLQGLEDRDIKPGRATSWSALLTRMNATRRNNRIYVRLVSASPGTVVGGEALPSLPASVRTILDEDKTVATSPVSKTVVGAWEQRMNRAVRGSRELTLTLTSK